MFRKTSLLALVAALSFATGASAAERIYSFDPADARTRGYVDNGLTIIFDKNLLGFRVKEVLSTQAKASAKVEAADERELGGRLKPLLPAGADGALYRIGDSDQGPGMIHAFCPGSTKGWLVFGALRPRQDVTVYALGDDPASGKARLCATLNLSFRGEWALPHGDPRIPPAPPLSGLRP